MPLFAILQAVQLLLIGVLAGEELLVRYGVQPALRSLPDGAHVAARIALVKRLKVVVPILMLPTVLASAALVVTAPPAGASTASFGWSIAGLAALVAFLLASFLGTVPINMAVDRWHASAPPADWRRTVHRWETIDTVRSGAAAVSFALFVVAALV